MPLYIRVKIFYIMICTLLIEISCLPDGAPDSVCETMLPSHGDGINPLGNGAPFLIETSSKIINEGENLEVTVSGSPQGLLFSGFMLQTRNANPPYEIIGKFLIDNEVNAKFMHCGTAVHGSITHKNTISKSSLTLQWEPPISFVGDVIFNGTIAQSFDTYWVGVLSKPVRVVKRGAAPELIDTTTSHNIYTSKKLAYIPRSTTRTPLLKKNNPFYTDCGSSKTCFGLPDGCLKDKSCKFISRISVRGDIFEFELVSNINSSKYIALGLSEDDKMGKDLITECVLQDGKVQFYSSFTSGAPNYGTSRTLVQQNSANLITSSFNDGVIYCKIHRDVVTKVQNEVFDLTNKKYHLLLAMGSSLKADGIGYHNSERIASASPINLAEIQDIEGSSTILLRMHGALMIIAWIGTTSLGILLARYFKRTWVGKKICGKDIWFTWHQFCMITTWALTMCSFVIIFIEIRGWSAEKNPHAILGLLTTILCFVQFFFGLFRPAPVSKRRPLFNWLHWFIGNSTQILAFITMFFSVKLTKAELPQWMDLILVNFVVFHVIAHLIYSVISCISDRYLNERSNTFQMENVSGIRQNVKKDNIDATFSGIRKWLLVPYVVILCLFVLTLVLIVILAPIDKTLNNFKSSLSS